MKQVRLPRVVTLGIRLGLLLLLLSAGVLAWDGLHDRLWKVDVALVLGSRVEPTGQPSARLQARLDRAVELYQHGFFAAIIVSGGTGEEGFDEARVMQEYLVAQGILPERIYQDQAGANTSLSASSAQRIMAEQGFESIMVISQYFHIPRSRLALQHCGVASIASAHARYWELRDLYSVLREVPAYYSYMLRACPR